MAKAQQQGAAHHSRGNQKAGEKSPDYQVDVSIKEPRQKKKIAGYDAREVVTTMTVYEKNNHRVFHLHLILRLTPRSSPVTMRPVNTNRPNPSFLCWWWLR